MVCAPMRCGLRGGREGIMYLLMFEAGLTPPASLAILGFQGEELKYNSEYWEVIAFCGLGAVIWAGFAFVVFTGTAARFRRTFGRELTVIPPPYPGRELRPRPIARLS